MIEYASSPRDARAGERLRVLEFLRGVDWLLMAGVAALVGYGLWAVAGITRYDVEGEYYYVVRQAIAAGAGLAGLLVALAIDPGAYRRLKRWIYLGTSGVLLVVLALGEAARGSIRWIQVGPVQFQPSEFGKLLFVLAIAAFLADRGKRVASLGAVATVAGLGLVPILLVFAQPDLGTALVYGAALAACLFVAGVRWTHLALLGSLVVFAAAAVVWLLPAAGVDVLEPYQKARLTAFLDPEKTPAGLRYNVDQSITAIGAGGLSGRGVSGATQTRLDYVPEDATDFAFAAFSEQRGFFGAAILLLLYLLVVWRGLRVVTVARDAFSAIVAGGVVAAFLFQVAVNVGMTMGIAPVTGIPLPFVTVGGSSLAANLLAVGVLQAIHARGGRRRR